MVHKTPVTFYGLNIFGLKYSEQILGSDLFWERWGREEGLGTDEGGGSASSCFLLLVWSSWHLAWWRFPLWIVGFWGNWLIREAKGDVSCYHLVYEKRLGESRLILTWTLLDKPSFEPTALKFITSQLQKSTTCIFFKKQKNHPP